MTEWILRATYCQMGLEGALIKFMRECAVDTLTAISTTQSSREWMAHLIHTVSLFGPRSSKGRQGHPVRNLVVGAWCVRPLGSRWLSTIEAGSLAEVTGR